MGCMVNATTPLLYPPGKRPSTHCAGGWVGPGAGLDGCGKFMLVLLVIMITIIYYYVSSRNRGKKNINFFNVLLKSGKTFCPVRSYCSLFSHHWCNVKAVNLFSGSIVTY